MNDDDAYAVWLADFILAYFTSQLQSGRSVIYESEIWQLLGQPLPEGREDRKYLLKEYHKKESTEDIFIEDGSNIINLANYRNKIN